MVEAVLFDLDGTLLPLDMDEFLKRYIPGLWRRFGKRISLTDFAKKLLASTDKMIENTDPEKTLHQVFWEDFAPGIGEPVEKLLPLADEFYRTDFADLGADIRADPAASRAVEAAKTGGRKTVLATNPIFPKIAIEERMRWAEIPRDGWDLITTYEISSFTKPNPDYYRWIADSIGVDPERCVMVGNDTREDLVAASIGMKTFLVKGYHIERSDGFVPDWEGDLDDFAALIQEGFSQ